MPGLTTLKTYTSGDYSWLLNTSGFDEATTGFGKVASFTKATHFPDGYLPCGLMLNVANEKDIKPFTGAAGEVLGFLMKDIPIAEGQTEGLGFAFIIRGQIRTANLPVKTNLPATAPAGFYFAKGE